LYTGHALLNYSNTLDFYINIFRQRLDSDTTPRWFRIPKSLNQLRVPSESYLLINFIHVRKVLHIRKEYIYLDNRIDARSSRLENGAQICETLFLQ